MNALSKFLRPVNFLASIFHLLVLGLSITLILTHRSLPPMVPLWFSKPWGLERLATPNNLWLIPLLIVGFFIVSNIVAKFLNQNYPSLSKILVWSSAFISLVFLLTLYKIILVAI